MPQSTNVMPDLAAAMKYNPNLQVMLNGGYYDLATPYFAADLRDAAPADSGRACRRTSSTQFYASGHMVYAQWSR